MIKYIVKVETHAGMHVDLASEVSTLNIFSKKHEATESIYIQCGTFLQSVEIIEVLTIRKTDICSWSMIVMKIYH